MKSILTEEELETARKEANCEWLVTTYRVSMDAFAHAIEQAVLDKLCAQSAAATVPADERGALQAQPSDEREACVKAARKWSIDVPQTPGDEFPSSHGYAFWLGWQARATLAAPAAPMERQVSISTEHGPWLKSSLKETLGEEYCQRCLCMQKFSDRRKCEPHIVPAVQAAPMAAIERAIRQEERACRAEDALIDLVNQIRKTSPVDNHGHILTMNMAYRKAVELLDAHAIQGIEPSLTAQDWHGALQRIGSVLGLLPGPNFLTDIVPAIERLQAQAAPAVPPEMQPQPRCVKS